MMNGADKSQSGWNLLLAVSLAGILVSAWAVFILPKPHPKVAENTASTIKVVENETNNLVGKVAEAEDKLAGRTWDVAAEVFGSSMLESLTHLADQHHVRLSNFSQGKPIPAADLQEAPFVVTVEGAFMDVMAMVNQLERPDSKIALSQLKIVSADSDHVTATLSLTGFLHKEAK